MLQRVAKRGGNRTGSKATAKTEPETHSKVFKRGLLGEIKPFCWHQGKHGGGKKRKEFSGVGGKRRVTTGGASTSCKSGFFHRGSFGRGSYRCVRTGIEFYNGEKGKKKGQDELNPEGNKGGTPKDQPESGGSEFPNAQSGSTTRD